MFENIKNELSRNSQIIEEALENYYDFTDSDFGEIIEAQKYSLLGGGKRIRAFLTMQFCKLFGGTAEAALPYACAVEMVHAYSLVHDDLPCMDNDDFRRGKPSNHKVYGETVALLAGDALLTNAFLTLSSNENVSSETNVKAVKLLSSNAGMFGMIGGQTIDIKAEKSKLEFETVVKLHLLKTGKLIMAAALLGALAAGVDENDPRWSVAENYAQKIGFAFQIEDDILEYENGEEELNSFLAFMTLDEAKDYVSSLTDQAIEDIKPYDDEKILVSLAQYLAKRDH